MWARYSHLAKYLSGVDVYGFGSRMLQIIPKTKRGEAWFSYPSMMQSIIKEYQVDLILDVGANRGQFAREIRKIYKGQIVSFEPVAGTFTQLKNAASQDKNWIVFNYALGNESKEQFINVGERDEFSSLLETNEYCGKHFGEKSSKSVKESVHLRRLDDIVNELPFDIYSKQILLKMDTQGYDLEVFRGASSIMKNLVALQSEVSQKPIYQGMPRWTESINEYEQSGFRLAGLFPVFRDGFQYIESDCLMVKALQNNT